MKSSIEAALRKQAAGDFSDNRKVGATLPPYSEQEMEICAQALNTLVRVTLARGPNDRFLSPPSEALPLL